MILLKDFNTYYPMWEGRALVLKSKLKYLLVKIE